MATVRYTAEELDRLPSQTDWARAKSFTDKEIERMAFDDAFEDGHGMAVNYIVNADGALTHRKTGVVTTPDELFAKVWAEDIDVYDAAE